MEYNKLVRDKIPDIIKKNGGNPVTHIADDEEYWMKLREKLEEETGEFLASDKIEEVADILEVLDAICEYKGIDKNKILEIKDKKRAERGGFKNKIILKAS